LKVLFDDGKSVVYSVKEDIETIESYKDPEAVQGLSEQVQLDESRTCVYRNVQIDLPGDTIYEYGIRCPTFAFVRLIALNKKSSAIFAGVKKTIILTAGDYYNETCIHAGRYR